jgi:hypothetical protein
MLNSSFFSLPLLYFSLSQCSSGGGSGLGQYQQIVLFFFKSTLKICQKKGSSALYGREYFFEVTMKVSIVELNRKLLLKREGSYWLAQW